MLFLLCWSNPFVPKAPFFYPLRTSENLTVFWCFYGIEKMCIGNEWVEVSCCYNPCIFCHLSLKKALVFVIIIIASCSLCNFSLHQKTSILSTFICHFEVERTCKTWLLGKSFENTCFCKTPLVAAFEYR